MMYQGSTIVNVLVPVKQTPAMAGKWLTWKKTSLVLISLMVIASCAGSPAVSKIPITKKGKMSTAVLALVKRQNHINNGNQIYTYPDGLAFYFIIYPSQTDVHPVIKQSQNFLIDGELYWQNIAGAYDSHTIIYNERTFYEQEPEAFAQTAVRENANAFIQKTVICGNPLPAQGIVVYPLFFGFGKTLEEFEFRFNVKDIPEFF